MCRHKATVFVLSVALLTAIVDILVLVWFPTIQGTGGRIEDVNLNSEAGLLHQSEKREIETHHREHYRMIICIKTSRSHGELREVLRQSWVGSAKKLPGVKVLFMLGEAPLEETENVTKLIQDEAEINKDINFLQGFTDNYRNLSSNTATVLKWLHSSAPFTFDWMLRADDDVWINIDRIFTALDSMPQEKLLWGDIFYNAPVKRDGKWGHTKEEWFLDFYPPYTNGPAYLLTSDVVSWLGEMLERNFLRLFHSAEDANVGVWLAGTNVRLLDDRTFMTSFAARLPMVPCDPMWNAVHRMRNFAQMLEWSRNWELCGCMCSCDPKYLSTKLVVSRRAAAANKINRS